MASENYLGNPNLKNVGQQIDWTEESLAEYMKCKDSVEYFISHYVKIIHVDQGLVPFEMYPYQKDMIHKFNDNRFVICKMPRQTGKSTTIIAFLLHYILFHESVNVAILANKGAVARELLSRLQLAYENLPKWLQQGVVVHLSILFFLMSLHTFLKISPNLFSLLFILQFLLVKLQKY